MPVESVNDQMAFEVARKIESREERRAYLREVCGEDPAMEQRLQALLSAYDESATFLESPAPELGSTIGRQIIESAGSVIGPYKLLEQIGEGGMGLVFMADQLRPVKRRVALKVLKPGMDTRQVIARFEAERQVLALMDHPNIAHVYDAGTTDSGRPYFIMELVRGVLITDYCDEHRLDIRQRLELFITVCHAIQHAHQKGIIHRDLKPTNILVTKNDTTAVPKVIDFGIAKATGQQVTERTLFTQFAQMIGTPLYMSPEQAEMNSLDVDTRSDVYSLGVLLYELLTGHTPFESETLKKAGLDEMRRMIREHEPPKPSQRLSTLAAEAYSTVSERRGVDGRRLGQSLRGELDWIVMKALEKDRNRRYESASALAADVQRYLSEEAVEACPPSASYRLRKYVRRNRRALVTAGGVAAALVVATTVSSWEATEARVALRQAEADRDRARNAEVQAKLDQERAGAAEHRAATEAAITRAVNEFLLGDLLGQVETIPLSSDQFIVDPDLTVREAIDRAAGKIGERFHAQPLVEAAIQTVIGQSYQRLTQNEIAITHFERALVLRQHHLGLDHPDTIASMCRLAAICSLAGRHPDAIALHQQIVGYWTTRLGPDSLETLARLGELAGAYRDACQWDMSVPLLEQILEKQRTIYGPAHPSTLGAMNTLAWHYCETRRFAESLALHAKALDIFKSTNGPEQEPPLGWLIRYGLACQRSAMFDQADQLFHAALEQSEKREDSVTRRIGRANILGWLGLNLLLQERYDEAEPLIRQTVAGFKTRFSDQFRGFYWMTIHGAVLAGQQRYAEAELLLLQGYEGMNQAIKLGIEGRQFAEASEYIVRFYAVTNQPEKAREWREKIDASGNGESQREAR